MKLGIVLPNWVGDVVMATPTLRALRRHFADAQLVGILRPHLVPVLEGTPWLDELFLYQPRAADPALRGWSMLRRLRREQFDTILLLTNSLRTGVMARLSGAPRRVGFARNGRGLLLTERLYHRRAGRRYVPSPVLDDYLRLAYQLGCPVESPRLELATSAADEAAADRAWQALSLPVGGDVVVLNSGGAFGAAKLWPTEYFAELARRIATQLGQSVLVICGPSEREIARQIELGAAHPRVRSLADQELSLGLSKACVRRGRLLVTTDSGPRHFGTAFGVPTVTLFGPTHIAWSETHDPRAVHLQHAVPCGPCQQRTCPLKHHRCMRDLSVDVVFDTVARHLEHRGGAHAA